jgi:hypothetical protein
MSSTSNGHAGEVASHHVSDGVAARLARCEADVGEVGQQVGYALELHEVELDVLPRGDVTPASAVLVGDPAQCVELFGRDRSVGQLHPHHLRAAALALTVDSVVEAEDTEPILVDLACEVRHEHVAELLDIRVDLSPDLRVEPAVTNLDGMGDGHG